MAAAGDSVLCAAAARGGSAPVHVAHVRGALDNGAHVRHAEADKADVEHEAVRAFEEDQVTDLLQQRRRHWRRRRGLVRSRSEREDGEHVLPAVRGLG